jgi:hypothetical protein
MLYFIWEKIYNNGINKTVEMRLNERGLSLLGLLLTQLEVLSSLDAQLLLCLALLALKTQSNLLGGLSLNIKHDTISIREKKFEIMRK